MSTPINDGGPAFPRVGEGVGNPHYDAPGMSLRDYFAGQALAGMCARDLTGNSLGNNHINNAQVRGEGGVRFAGAAYELADAMLRARNGGQK